MKFVTVFLSCANTVEADTIVTELLNKKLVACVKQTSVNSTYRWKGKIENTEEMLLIMDSADIHFEQIEKVVKKIHSYETVVLTAVPMTHVAAETKAWFKENL